MRIFALGKAEILQVVRQRVAVYKPKKNREYANVADICTDLSLEKVSWVRLGLLWSPEFGPWCSFSGAAQVLAVSSMHWIAFLGKTGQFRCAAAQRNYLGSDSVFCGASSPFLSGWFMLTDDLENFCFGQG